MGCWHVEILLTIIRHVQTLLEPLWAIYLTPLFLGIPTSGTYKTGRGELHLPIHSRPSHLNHP
jgi:hypothetical protein